MPDASLKARTRLGERLLEIRKRVVASGERLLSPEEIENESCANCVDLKHQLAELDQHLWGCMDSHTDVEMRLCHILNVADESARLMGVLYGHDDPDSPLGALFAAIRLARPNGVAWPNLSEEGAAARQETDPDA